MLEAEEEGLVRPKKLLSLYLAFHYLNLCSSLSRRMCKHFLWATCHKLLLDISKNACFPLTWSCVTDLHLRPHYKCRVLQCQQPLFNLFCWCTVMQSRYSTQILSVKVNALVSVIMDQLRGFHHRERSTCFFQVLALILSFCSVSYSSSIPMPQKLLGMR
jgi:hypothetical protein